MAKERIMLRVAKGALEPAHQAATDRLREMGLRVGDVVLATLHKPRNPAFHRLVHQIGALAAANIDAFAGMSAHAVIKRLQVEAGIQCERQIIEVPGVGAAQLVTAKSIAFDRMDEVEFRELAKGLCRHIAERYWPEMTAEAVEEMAGAFVDEG